jgi:hypothetical protein
MADKKIYGYHGHAGHRRGGTSSDGLFGWTIFIFLLIGLVFLCWMGSYYIFAKPETAANYRLLQRLHKLEPPQRFEVTAAPRGEFLKPSELLERFGSMTTGEIRRSNETLLRSFIRNYHQNRDLVPYAVGTYKVLGTLPLSEKTFCSSGVVALLQAVEQPEILLEQLFTANANNLPALNNALKPGQEIKLEKPLDLSAIVHIDRLPDQRIRLTTMPLLYGSYGSGHGPASFSLEPPIVLNLEAGLPVIKTSEIEQFSGKTLFHLNGDKSGGHLTRVFEETANPTPAPTIQKAIPIRTPLPSSQQRPISSPTVQRAIPVNTTAVLPAIPVETPAQLSTPTPTPEIAAATPSPTPKPTVSDTPPLLPSIVTTNGNATTATPPPTLPVATPSQPWPVYAPGKMPRGALLNPSETSELAAHGTGHERHYLQGRFSVTASGNGKAVLRPESALAGIPLLKGSKIRVIVEFPADATPPSEGNTVSRDATRPFQIISVKRGEDGVLNVYAREVTREE